MSTDTNTPPRVGISGDGAPPFLALALGWAGVLPFWGLALALPAGIDLPVTGDEASALVSYGAIILSFMAGVHWGLAMRAPDAPAGPRATWLLAISVVPAIIAWFATLAPAGVASSSSRSFSWYCCRSIFGRLASASRRPGTGPCACS